jgi:hypothetical protein
MVAACRPDGLIACDLASGAAGWTWGGGCFPRHLPLSLIDRARCQYGLLYDLEDIGRRLRA